jgi:hypothetical protein
MICWSWQRYGWGNFWLGHSLARLGSPRTKCNFHNTRTSDYKWQDYESGERCDTDESRNNIFIVNELHLIPFVQLMFPRIIKHLHFLPRPLSSFWPYFFDQLIFSILRYFLICIRAYVNSTNQSCVSGLYKSYKWNPRTFIPGHISSSHPSSQFSLTFKFSHMYTGMYGF